MSCNSSVLPSDRTREGDELGAVQLTCASGSWKRPQAELPQEKSEIWSKMLPFGPPNVYMRKTEGLELPKTRL